MNIDSYLLLTTLVKLVLALTVLKVLRWLIEYIYRLWMFSYIPGPITKPFIGDAFRFCKVKSEAFKAILDTAKEFQESKICRVWMATNPVIIFHRPDELQSLFDNSKFNDKSFDYTLVHPWLRTGLVVAGGEQWAKRRKLITPSFHFDILKDFLLVINEHADILVENLKIATAQNDKIELNRYFSACTLDVICETAMGQNVNAQTDKNSQYVDAVKKMCDALTERMLRPWLWPDFIFKFSNCWKKQKECLKILHGFTRKIVAERAENFVGLNDTNRKRVAFLDTLLDARLRDPNSISIEGIEEEVDTFMFEGHDTTASALNFAAFAIAKHPDVQKKLHDEVDAVLGDSKRPITTDDLNKLSYLECVIKETLRLYPSVPVIGREIKEDSIIGGYKVLKNCSIMIYICTINRDKRYFPEPDHFKPERFLNQNDETDPNNNNNNNSNNKTRPPFTYLPFSAGRRNCIGQKFAMMELKVILANLLRYFNLECDQDEKELKLYAYIILRTEVPIMVKLKSRYKN